MKHAVPVGGAWEELDGDAEESAGDAGEVEVSDGVRAVAGQVKESTAGVLELDERGHDVLGNAEASEGHVAVVGEFGGVHDQPAHWSMVMAVSAAGASMRLGLVDASRCAVMVEYR